MVLLCVWVCTWVCLPPSVKEIRRPDGEEGEAGYEPPHGEGGNDERLDRQRAEAERQRQREIERRAAAARFDDSDSDNGAAPSAGGGIPTRRAGGGGGSGGNRRGGQPSRIPRSPRGPPAPVVPDHSDIEVDSLGDSDESTFPRAAWVWLASQRPD